MTFQALETALPDVSGWEKGKPEGERMTSPMPFSKTESDYQKGEATSPSVDHRHGGGDADADAVFA